jgi:hypothetical protein
VQHLFLEFLDAYYHQYVLLSPTRSSYRPNHLVKLLSAVVKPSEVPISRIVRIARIKTKRGVAYRYRTAHGIQITGVHLGANRVYWSISENRSTNRIKIRNGAVPRDQKQA